jgi:hypothetical protein
LEPCNLGGGQANMELVHELEMDWEAFATTLEVGNHFAF